MHQTAASGALNGRGEDLFLRPLDLCLDLRRLANEFLHVGHTVLIGLSHGRRPFLDCCKYVCHAADYFDCVRELVYRVPYRGLAPSSSARSSIATSVGLRRSNVPASWD